MGPKDIELIDYCVKKGKSIDDLPENDPMMKKYFDGIIYWDLRIPHVRGATSWPLLETDPTSVWKQFLSWG